MVHLTTLDRKIMGQMVRRRLRHAAASEQDGRVLGSAGVFCGGFELANPEKKRLSLDSYDFSCSKSTL